MGTWTPLTFHPLRRSAGRGPGDGSWCVGSVRRARECLGDSPARRREDPRLWGQFWMVSTGGDKFGSVGVFAKRGKPRELGKRPGRMGSPGSRRNRRPGSWWSPGHRWRPGRIRGPGRSGPVRISRRGGRRTRGRRRRRRLTVLGQDLGKLGKLDPVPSRGLGLDDARVLGSRHPCGPGPGAESGEPGRFRKLGLPNHDVVQGWGDSGRRDVPGLRPPREKDWVPADLPGGRSGALPRCPKPQALRRRTVGGRLDRRERDLLQRASDAK